MPFVYEIDSPGVCSPRAKRKAATYSGIPASFHVYLVGRFQSSNHISGLETPGFTGPKRMLDMSGFMESVV